MSWGVTPSGHEFQFSQGPLQQASIIWSLSSNPSLVNIWSLPPSVGALQNHTPKAGTGLPLGYLFVCKGSRVASKVFLWALKFGGPICGTALSLQILQGLLRKDGPFAGYSHVFAKGGRLPLKYSCGPFVGVWLKFGGPICGTRLPIQKTLTCVGHMCNN
jgi:hypothetical protein